MSDEHIFTLRQADQARTEFAAIEGDLEFIMGRLARLPTRGDLAKTALGIIFCSAVSIQQNRVVKRNIQPITRCKSTKLGSKPKHIHVLHTANSTRGVDVPGAVGPPYAMGNSRLRRYAKTVTNMPSCRCKLPRSERARQDAFLTIAIA